MNLKSPSRILVVCGTRSDAITAFIERAAKDDIVRTCKRQLALELKSGTKILFVREDVPRAKLDGMSARVVYDPSSTPYRWNWLKATIEAAEYSDKNLKIESEL